MHWILFFFIKYISHSRYLYPFYGHELTMTSRLKWLLYSNDEKYFEHVFVNIYMFDVYWRVLNKNFLMHKIAIIIWLTMVCLRSKNEPNIIVVYFIETINVCILIFFLYKRNIPCFFSFSHALAHHWRKVFALPKEMRELKRDRKSERREDERAREKEWEKIWKRERTRSWEIKPSSEENWESILN